MAFFLKDKLGWEAVPAAQFHKGSQATRVIAGPAGANGSFFREDVPDSLGQLAGSEPSERNRSAISARAPIVVDGDIDLPVFRVAGLGRRGD